MTCIAVALAALAIAAASPPLNVVVILADDLGATDLGYTGNTYHESPHIDRLAEKGVRFTQAYAAAPVCSPTRAALMTGKHPARLHITIWAEAAISGQGTRRKLKSAASEHNLPHSETTLAARLHAAGYMTGLFGKWHLGDEDHSPETHGFDVNRGGSQWGAPQTYFWPYRGSGRFGQQYRYLPGLDYGTPGEYLTDRLTAEAVEFMSRATAAGKPFFLYLAHHRRTRPSKPSRPTSSTFAARSNPTHRGRTRFMPRWCGAWTTVLAACWPSCECGASPTTPWSCSTATTAATSVRTNDVLAVTSNFPLRSGKGSLYEGGVRVPLIVRWPGRTPPAGGECREPVTTADLFPTLLAAAGLRPDPATSADSTDLGPLLTNPAATLHRDALYWHYPHYYETTTPVGSIRAGQWKLLEYFEDGRRELYDLNADPSERTNLAAAQPDRVSDLYGRMVAWRKQVGANMPTPNR